MITPVMDIGGAEKVARDIALEAPAGQFEFHYLILKDPVGVYEQQLLAAGCKTFHVPEPSENYWNYYCSLVRIMKQGHYDAVHAHTMFSIGWVMLAAWQAHIPVRISHSHSALQTNSGFLKKGYEAAMRLLINTFATDYISCGVAAGERLYGKRKFSKHGKLILNGIDTTQFQYSEETRWQIRQELNADDRFIIGHVGHLVDVKNQGFLLELMPAILSKKQNALLLLLGEGPDRQMLEQKISAMGLEASVRLMGNVNNVGDYLSAMDVFAFPSLYEGMPLSILEVQANGLPCILSDRVPKDVFLTDLLSPLSLDAPKEQWADAICSAERPSNQDYAALIRQSGFDTSSAYKGIYTIYQKG